MPGGTHGEATSTIPAPTACRHSVRRTAEERAARRYDASPSAARAAEVQRRAGATGVRSRRARRPCVRRRARAGTRPLPDAHELRERVEARVLRPVERPRAFVASTGAGPPRGCGPRRRNAPASGTARIPASAETSLQTLVSPPELDRRAGAADNGGLWALPSTVRESATVGLRRTRSSTAPGRRDGRAKSPARARARLSLPTALPASRGAGAGSGSRKAPRTGAAFHKRPMKSMGDGLRPPLAASTIPPWSACSSPASSSRRHPARCSGASAA
jgi:hypothetical protein